MKTFGTALLLLTGTMASMPGLAAMDVTQGARIGAAVGRYSGHGEVTTFDSGGNVVPAFSLESTNVRVTYGGELGYAIQLNDFYADVGLNLLRVRFQDEDNWRTDLLVTLGYYLNYNWSLFAGFRRGWQGDGIFNDESFKELGPYVGIGYGGLNLGDWGSMNMSAAYNFDKAKDFPLPGDDFDYPGVSLKFGLGFKNTPHSLQLRLQRFSGDDSRGFSDGSHSDFELTETWAVLSYIYTLAW